MSASSSTTPWDDFTQFVPQEMQDQMELESSSFHSPVLRMVRPGDVQQQPSGELFASSDEDTFYTPARHSPYCRSSGSTIPVMPPVDVTNLQQQPSTPFRSPDGALAIHTTFLSPASTDSFQLSSLNLDYIENCIDSSELNGMQAYLASRGCFPALLRGVEKRLLELMSPLPDYDDFEEAQSVAPSVATTIQSEYPLTPWRDKAVDTQKDEQDYVQSYQQEERTRAEMTRLQQQIAATHRQLEQAECIGHTRVEELRETVAQTETKARGLEHQLRETTLQNQTLQARMKQAQVEKKSLESQLAHQDTQVKKECRVLERKLKGMEEYLQVLREERDSMLASMQRAVGREGENVSMLLVAPRCSYSLQNLLLTFFLQLSDLERRRILDDFSKNATLSKTVIDATSRALAQCERERIREREAAEHTQARQKVKIQEASEKITSLEQEIGSYTQQLSTIQQEMHDLKSSFATERLEWNSREGTYKSQVQRLLSDSSTIPVGLFQHIKREADSRLSEVQTLRHRVLQLEAMLQSKWLGNDMGKFRTVLQGLAQQSKPLPGKLKPKVSFARVEDMVQGTSTWVPSIIEEPEKAPGEFPQEPIDCVKVSEEVFKVESKAQEEKGDPAPAKSTTRRVDFAFDGEENALSLQQQVRSKLTRKAGGKKGLQKELQKIRRSGGPFRIVN